MRKTAVILDCYTVEPSGLGVPPYLSAYVRDAYSALSRALPGVDVRYLTIDDVRWVLNGGVPSVAPPLSDALTYSATANRDHAIGLLRDAVIVVVIAGDAVPSVHLHARNGALAEITRVLTCVRGRRVLLGPLVAYAKARPAAMFDALHSHTVTSAELSVGSAVAAPYERLRADRDSYAELVAQLRWRPIAEIELYRGCTRRRFCSFCNEPVKAPSVDFRDVGDVLDEIARLSEAGVRDFRLGQQTCFFSYHHRDPERIERLLAGVWQVCPELAVLHIDNADPLAVASPAGKRIAALVARYCTEGNCAPMGVETFDPAVVARNALTCSPEVLLRAVENVNDVGAARGPGGLPTLLPGLNLVYGLPGETHRTHMANLTWLSKIYERGMLCHRTNVRQARAFPGTPLAAIQQREPPPSAEHFPTWKADIDQTWDAPMKMRVYPRDLRVAGLHSFFVTGLGTWFRRLGSYSIQIVEPDTAGALYEPADLVVTGHAPRHLYGERHAV